MSGGKIEHVGSYQSGLQMGAEIALSTQPASQEDGDEAMHPDSEKLLADFTAALRAKMVANEKKYGWTNHWSGNDWQDECTRQIIHHMAKGDPRDVAIYAAFMWHHGWPTVSANTILNGDEVREIRHVSMNIVNQLFDEAEVPVEKRQEINDLCDAFVSRLITAHMQPLVVALEKCEPFMHDFNAENITDESAGIIADHEITMAYNSLRTALSTYKK